MSNEKIPLRKDVPSEYKWDLTKLYKTEKDWEEDLKKIPDLTKKFMAFKGHPEIVPTHLVYNDSYYKFRSALGECRQGCHDKNS